MDIESSDAGGFVQEPRTGAPAPSESWQHAVVHDRGFADLTQGSDRVIGQIEVMGGVSPNVAAKSLGLPTGRWEWLHLVAFSIGVTHADNLSAHSWKLIERSDRPTQIPENLVLGTHETNTVMLTYETIIKDILREHQDWKLELWVGGHIEKRPMGGHIIPVGTRIDYHFLFKTSHGRVSRPFIVTFDPLSHSQPPQSEYDQMRQSLLRDVAEDTTTPLFSWTTSATGPGFVPHATQVPTFHTGEIGGFRETAEFDFLLDA